MMDLKDSKFQVDNGFMVNPDWEVLRLYLSCRSIYAM